MYDPILGRMLAPDNFVQLPDFTQSFNRYAYALNIPLVYTDPDGELVWFIPVIIGAVVGGYTGASIQSGTAAFWNWQPDAWKGAIVGAFIGAAAGAGVLAIIGPTGGITGITTSAGTVSQGWGITTTALQSANVNMAFTTFGGGDIDNIYKSGLVGAASGAFTATGGFGMVNAWGSKSEALQFVGRQLYQGIGTAGTSIGNNWAMGRNAFSSVTVGIGPVNFTFGKGQNLLQWQNNIGNIAINTFGLANTAFGGKVRWNWKNLTAV